MALVIPIKREYINLGTGKFYFWKPPLGSVEPFAENGFFATDFNLWKRMGGYRRCQGKGSYIKLA